MKECFFRRAEMLAKLCHLKMIDGKTTGNFVHNVHVFACICVRVFTTCTTTSLFLPLLTPPPFPPSLPPLLQDGVDVYQGTVLLPTTQVNDVS